MMNETVRANISRMSRKDVLAALAMCEILRDGVKPEHVESFELKIAALRERLARLGVK